MKKQVILAIALLVSFTAFSQETHKVMGWKISRDIPQNEVKLNLVTTLFWLYPEVSYERILSEDFSLGAAAGVSLGDEYLLNFGLIPYARWFFGGSSQTLQKYGAGFFIEANGALLSQRKEYWEEYRNSKSVFGAGLGLALGWKYLTRNNWVGELSFGAGRDFVNNGAYSRFSISIGKRF